MGVASDVPGEVDKRGVGFEAACRRLQIEHERIILRNADGEAPFYAFLQEHLHDGRLDFDGIFCNTDRLVCRIRAFLAERGVRIPQDVQLIGYDGITDYATGRHACSTIVQPIAQMAETAVRLLLNGGEASAPRNICLPVRYAPGGTTKD